MNIHSIHWRLPLSYSAIALVAALALGSVMLLVLNSFYARFERGYLLQNALALKPIVEEILQADLSKEPLEDQVKGMAFVSQTQIRVLDAEGNVIADSGIPESNQVIALSSKPFNIVMFSAPVDAPADRGPIVKFYADAGGDSEVQVLKRPDGNVTATRVDTIMSVQASPFGYGFVQEVAVSPDHRSSQVVGIPLNGSLGVLEISNGPAYGSDILRSVAMAWLMAGVIAIALAALAGWYASRQVTQPVLALTDATDRMERGELSTRVVLQNEGQQEFIALAQSFNNMAGRVEETVSTLRAFVADAAHELHTPLTALHTNLELAADENNASARTLYLTRAQEQGQRLEALVGGLLDLSRVEANHNEEPKERVGLTSLLQQLAESFASRAEQAERTFQLDLPGNSLMIEGIPGQIQRAIENLLENALKFTEKGDTISLSLESEKDDAVLYVTDTGIGIPSADLPRLFGRFHRGQNTSTLPGSGLGLAIVRAIVESHHGRVEAKSEGVGQGSSFLMRLPLVQ